MWELNSITCLVPRPFACHLGTELIVSNVFHLKHTVFFFYLLQHGKNIGHCTQAFQLVLQLWRIILEGNPGRISNVMLWRNEFQMQRQRRHTFCVIVTAWIRGPRRCKIRASQRKLIAGFQWRHNGIISHTKSLPRLSFLFTPNLRDKMRERRLGMGGLRYQGVLWSAVGSRLGG